MRPEPTFQTDFFRTENEAKLEHLRKEKLDLQVKLKQINEDITTIVRNDRNKKYWLNNSQYLVGSDRMITLVETGKHNEFQALPETRILVDSGQLIDALRAAEFL